MNLSSRELKNKLKHTKAEITSKYDSYICQTMKHIQEEVVNDVAKHKDHN